MENNIKLIREEAGLTQAELAKMAGVTANYVSIMENGKKEPSLRTLAKIARALNVSTAALLDADLDKDLNDLKKRYDVQDLIRGINRFMKDLA